jgi:transcriptional regulator with XRE-family HTH domain
MIAVQHDKLGAARRTWVPIAAAGLIAFVGTGALKTSGFHQSTGAQKQWPTSDASAADSPEKKGAIAASTSTRLAVLRQTLGLSMSELGRVLGVTRQAIYNWQRGGAIEPANDLRLKTVVSALEPYLALFAERPGGIGDRAIDGRRTLLDALSDGMPVEEAFSRLAAILSAEDQQTQRLSALLRHRQGEPGADDLDALG